MYVVKVAMPFAAKAAISSRVSLSDTFTVTYLCCVGRAQRRYTRSLEVGCTG